MHRRLCVFIAAVSAVCLVTAAPGLHAQAKEPKLPGQYKRVHQNALKMITSGNVDKALQYLAEYDAKFPDDPETYFMSAVAHSMAGNKEQAEAYAALAVAKGLPPQRFIAGPRDLLKAVQEDDNFRRRYLTDNDYRIVHGPMLGSVTDRSAKLWVRVAQPLKVWAEVHDAAGDKLVSKTRPVQATKESDYTAVVELTGLRPATRYRYTVFLEGVKPAKGTPARSGPHAFATSPPPGAKSKFTLAFGGGAGYVPPHERMWTTIANHKPDLLLMLGDNVYIDQPTSPDMQRYCYYRRFSRPEWRRLVATTPVYSIWDDHDFATNDSWGGPAIDEPKWKRPVWEIYKHNWVNPGYGGGAKQPGCWYSFSVGDVDFIMLDGRYYRTSPKIEHPSMLGPAQIKWLRDTLKQSKGTFKVICSGVPWTFFAKGNSKDTWNGFRDEREQVFDYLAQQKIDGVVLMSADRHRSDMWKIDRADGYTLYEFNSSRLTNQHVHGTMRKAEFSYNKKQSFGLVTFDTTAADPTVTYKIMTIDDQTMFTFTLKRSQLTHK